MNLQEYVLRLRNSTLAFSNEFKLPSRRTSRLQSVQEGHFPKSRSIGGSSPVKDPARINQKRIERHCRARLRSTSAGLSCRRDTLWNHQSILGCERTTRKHIFTRVVFHVNSS
ncbi:hypothetical protein YC2023_040839 [Brassica napus]